MKLPDFVKKDDITEYLENSLKEDSVNRSRQDFSSVVAPENITECLRRMYYRINCYESNTRRYIDFSHKICIVNKWASYFLKCKQVSLVDKDILVTHSEYNIAGRVSAYIECNDSKYVVNVCPLDPKDFSKFSKGTPRRKDVITTMIYIWLSELKADGLLIYENNDNQDYSIYHVQQYLPIIKTVKRKCKQLIMHKLKGIKPPQIKGDNADKECNVCEYKSICLN